MHLSLIQLIQAHGHVLLAHLPLVGTFVFGTLVLPALAGIYLHRAARRRLRGTFWSSRVSTVLIPVGTVFAVNQLWPEVFVLVPAGAGLVAGWALREYLDGRVRTTAIGISIVTAVVGGALGALLLRLARIGLWDALAMLVAAGLGYVVGCSTGRREFDWRRVALAGVSTCGFLVVAEILVRLALPTLPMYYSSDSMSIRFPPFDRARGEAVPQTPFDADLDLSTCTPLYADDIPYPYAFPQLADVWQSVPSRVVVHLGDSMTEGVNVNSGETFTDVLQQTTPDVRQINMGLGGTAPDFYLLIARKRVPHLPAQLVVVHVFIGNDIEGLGKPYRCCADGPLLSLTGDRIEPRCPTPRWRDGFGESLAWFAAVSPPPAIVRQFTPESQFARYFVAATEGFRQRYFAASDAGGERWDDLLESRERSGRPPSERAEGQWMLFEAIMRALRDDLAQRHVGLAVSILPLSVALEKSAPQATESYRARTRILEILNRLDIEALDPWDGFESLVKTEGRDAVFLPQGDVHLNANGHRFYAEWLLQQLGPRLSVPSTATTALQ